MSARECISLTFLLRPGGMLWCPRNSPCKCGGWVKGEPEAGEPIGANPRGEATILRVLAEPVQMDTPPESDWPEPEHKA